MTQAFLEAMEGWLFELVRQLPVLAWLSSTLLCPLNIRWTLWQLLIYVELRGALHSAAFCFSLPSSPSCSAPLACVACVKRFAEIHKDMVNIAMGTPRFGCVEPVLGNACKCCYSRSFLRKGMLIGSDIEIIPVMRQLEFFQHFDNLGEHGDVPEITVDILGCLPSVQGWSARAWMQWGTCIAGYLQRYYAQQGLASHGTSSGAMPVHRDSQLLSWDSDEYCLHLPDAWDGR